MDDDGGSAADCSSKPTFVVGSCDISATLRDNYAAELFETSYVENGLVMNTASAISRATSFVGKCRSVENQNVSYLLRIARCYMLSLKHALEFDLTHLCCSSYDQTGI